jgi:hypothetical protein
MVRALERNRRESPSGSQIIEKLSKPIKESAMKKSTSQKQHMTSQISDTINNEAKISAIVFDENYSDERSLSNYIVAKNSIENSYEDADASL